MALMGRRVGDWKKKEEPSRLLLVVVCGFMENMILRGLLKIKKQLLKEPRITEMEREKVAVGQANTGVGVEAPHFDAHIVLDHNTREGGGNQSQWTMTLKDGNFHIPIIEYGDKKDSVDCVVYLMRTWRCLWEKLLRNGKLGFLSGQRSNSLLCESVTVGN
ncbi:hypothetical protein OROGR_024106 [Orobanche gracilis]